MAQSALEKELGEKTEDLLRFLRSHDRGVIVGLALSSLPIFPTALIGLLLNCINYKLFKKGRLDVSEQIWINRGIILGLINTFVSLGLMFLFYSIAAHIGWRSPLDWLRSMMPHLLPSLFQPRVHEGTSEICL